MFLLSFQTYFKLVCLISDGLTGVLVSELLLFGKTEVNPWENTKQIPGLVVCKAVYAVHSFQDTVEASLSGIWVLR